MSRQGGALVPMGQQSVPKDVEKVSTHLAGAAEWASRWAVFETELRRKNLQIVLYQLSFVLLIGVVAWTYSGPQQHVAVLQQDRAGALLKTTQLQLLSDASDVMKRDSVQRFFRALRSSSQQPRYQQRLSEELAALTAANSAAERSVEDFARHALGERLSLEVEAAVTATEIATNQYRVEVVETDARGRQNVLRGHATVDVAVDAVRNVDLNPWGVFVRSFSLDGALGGQ